MVLAHCPRAPVLFYKPLGSLINPNDTIIIPRVAQPVAKHLPDYEVEFTIVIGKRAKDVTEEEALDYVLAYTGANDVGPRVLECADFRRFIADRFHSGITRCWCPSGVFQKPSVSTDEGLVKCSLADAVLKTTPTHSAPALYLQTPSRIPRRCSSTAV